MAAHLGRGQKHLRQTFRPILGLPIIGQKTLPPAVPSPRQEVTDAGGKC